MHDISLILKLALIPIALIVIIVGGFLLERKYGRVEISDRFAAPLMKAVGGIVIILGGAIGWGLGLFIAERSGMEVNLGHGGLLQLPSVIATAYAIFIIVIGRFSARKPPLSLLGILYIGLTGLLLGLFIEGGWKIYDDGIRRSNIQKKSNDQKKEEEKHQMKFDRFLDEGIKDEQAKKQAEK